MTEPIPEKKTRRSRKPWFTDAQVQILATAFVAIIVGCSQALTVYLASRGNTTANEIKEELNINNNGLGSKLDNIEKTGDQTHAIVNSGSVAQDKLLSVTAKSLAVITKDPADILAAEIATEEYKKNLEQQKSIDAKAFPIEKEKQP